LKATAAKDPALRKQLLALSPTVRSDESERVAQCAYTTGPELASAEHNVIVVTAKGQPFEKGIFLDNWR